MLTLNGDWIVMFVGKPSVGVAYVDPDSWREATGYGVEVLDRGGFHRLVHPEDATHLHAKLFGARQEHASVEVDFRFRMADGRYERIHAVASPMSEEFGSAYHGFLLIPGPEAAPLPPNGHKLITIPEAAHALGVAAETVYRQARTDPGSWAHKVGRAWRVDLDALRTHLEKRR